ncbi:Zinc finger BED domain containing protein 1 [Dissostichus eleginoides]|uniref:Zinc finger BED domain containing protein 1 n=1 Tax=Dissostichus eleginoides TaxID=100907 RepID=A0AAD9EXQ6_DISEL|nr:Zinc finger BED domain containing protein 1 [Dissostichus eleginoides]
MANGVDERADQLNKNCEIEDAPSTFKAVVWQHFGFPVSRNDKGEKQTDKRQTICKSCRATVAYNSGNTSNMRSHLSHHHPEKLRTQQPTEEKA